MDMIDGPGSILTGRDSVLTAAGENSNCGGGGGCVEQMLFSGDFPAGAPGGTLVNTNIGFHPGPAPGIEITTIPFDTFGLRNLRITCALESAALDAIPPASGYIGMSIYGPGFSTPFLVGVDTFTANDPGFPAVNWKGPFTLVTGGPEVIAKGWPATDTFMNLGIPLNVSFATVRIPSSGALGFVQHIRNIHIEVFTVCP